MLKTASLDKAKAALKASGYNGEKVVILGVMEQPALAAMCQVGRGFDAPHGHERRTGGDGLRHHGAARRTSREPTDKGGWSLFVTVWTGADILHPAVHQMLRAGGKTAWFGWPDNAELEALRDQWAEAPSEAEQKRLATAIQVQAFKVLPYIPLGSLINQVAFRKNVKGVFPCVVAAYWNIGKG